MKLVSWAAGVSAVVVLTIACGSSDDGATDDKAGSAPFAGGTTTQSAQTCLADSDCDKHDPCVTFKCEIGTGENGIGQCSYSLATSCESATDSGIPYKVGRVDGGVAEDPDAGKVDPDAGAVCAKMLAVTFTQQSAGTCVYNTTVVESSPAKLDYMCTGGPATVTFGEQKFSGSITNDDVSLTNVDLYTFTNEKYKVTCAYRSTQTITGSLSSGTLTYSYTEKIEPNQPTLCPFVTTPCSASGPVTVK
jgi:hypothetical protein